MKIIRSGGDLSQKESFLGSELTGANLATGRTITLANISLSKNEMISVDGFVQTNGTDYTITHNHNSSVITFIGIIQDTQHIEVLYFIKR